MHVITIAIITIASSRWSASTLSHSVTHRGAGASLQGCNEAGKETIPGANACVMCAVCQVRHALNVKRVMQGPMARQWLQIP